MLNLRWGEFFVAAAAFLGVALIVCAMVWGHHSSTASLYESLIEQYNPSRNYLVSNGLNFEAGTGAVPLVVTPERREYLTSSAEDSTREGARWAGNARCHVNIWAILLLVVVLFLVLHQYWMQYGFHIPVITTVYNRYGPTTTRRRK